MPTRSLFLTSESVTEGHPDKMADQISDSVLDAVLAEDSAGRVACETLITTGLVVVSGEISTTTYVDIPRLVRSRITEIGYTRAKYGFDAETCGVVVALDEQSPDIMAMPVVTSVSQATRPSGSSARTASRIASEIWSAILSGCPSVTDSEVKRVR